MVPVHEAPPQSMVIFYSHNMFAWLSIDIVIGD